METKTELKELKPVQSWFTFISGDGHNYVTSLYFHLILNTVVVRKKNMMETATNLVTSWISFGTWSLNSGYFLVSCCLAELPTWLHIEDIC